MKQFVFLDIQQYPDQDMHQEKEILDAVSSVTKAYRVKSRNYTKNGADYVIELSVKKPEDLTAKLNGLDIEKYSVIEYDSEDII